MKIFTSRLTLTTALFIVFISSSQVMAAKGIEYHCGDAIFYLEKIGKYENSRLFIKAKSNNRETFLWKHSIDYSHFQCVQNKNKQHKALINAWCGGTGCTESSYTIIDARTLMVELVPYLRRNNLKLAEEVLGVEIENTPSAEK